ncbi:TetR/AcrR family transcriptional regulator [Actinomadura parmotrematis]|uniref:TetR/AcrR family transcriptional regulator n=1 Tax=Actinomadura parmotrematis TaxID=2864039 RepID=A0ABS7G314_9ACTN|nr:TetR/AcrR family transcriptional regulator [Actinomadura parmotrematis]MBW8487108.1 TetR/AcrR family transcriptional regulator [Actinomadura parmotrematis]
MDTMTSPRPRPAERPPRGRRRASHSMEAVLSGAVALLDEAGASALTIRALAARLGTGVGSIYWYVSGKEDLVDRAVDHVLGGVLTAFEERADTADPIDDLRWMAVTLFDAIVDRPWLGGPFMLNVGSPNNSLRIYEKIGQQTLRLDLTPRQRFHAGSGIVSLVVGNAVDLGEEPPPEVLEGATDRDAFLRRYTDMWRTLDPDEFPFMRQIAGEVDGHDDREQFIAALDLTLAGLRLQAGA